MNPPPLPFATAYLPLPPFRGEGGADRAPTAAFPVPRPALERLLAALGRRDDATAALVCRGEPALACWIALHRTEGWSPGDDYAALVAWLRKDGAPRLAASWKQPSPTPPAEGTPAESAWRNLRRNTLRQAAQAVPKLSGPLDRDHFQAVLATLGAWLQQAGVPPAARPAWVGPAPECSAAFEEEPDSAAVQSVEPDWGAALTAALSPLPPEIAEVAVPPQALLEALAEFSAGAGHEINNPLATIAGRAELLARGEADPQRRRDLAAIQAQALRAHEMIADLMTFARPPTPRPERFDPARWINALEPKLQKAAAQRSLNLRVETTSTAALFVDPRLLESALRGVLDNAFEWSPAGGTILIAVSAAAPGAVAVDVEDEGPGWPAEAGRLLFLPYYAARQAGRGLGVGLSKAWRLLRAADGDLHLTRTSQGRTCARLQLPAAE